MGRVHIWLKRSYIVVISLTAIISLLLLGLTLFFHGYIHRQEEMEKELRGIHVMYVAAVVIIVLTMFGAFGVCKEKKWALIVFAVGMILSSLLMLVDNIYGLVVIPKLAENTKKQYLNQLPLVNATDTLHELQTELKCCGIEGYQDWNASIPESCLCTKESTNPCISVGSLPAEQSLSRKVFLWQVAAPRNSSLVNGQKDDLPVMIYEKGCLQYLIEIMMTAFRVLFGVAFVVLLLWVLSIVLCIAILCQLDRNKDNTAVN